MTVVQTLAGLEAVAVPTYFSAGAGSLNLYQYSADYATIYRTQPNVRTVVDFLARNIAQLGLHVYQRTSDVDRRRLSDHPLDQLGAVLNPWTTRYRMIQSTVADLAIYDNCYWLKLRAPGRPLALLRVPPQFMAVRGVLMPTQYVLQLSGDQRREFTPAEVVHFRGHNPDSQTVGLSPLETLRRILAEEAAAGDYRAGFWRHGAKASGYITRPASAPEWSEPARVRFLAQFDAMTNSPDQIGGTAVLEEGMTFEKNAFSAEDSEYIAGRKLTREEVARAYHVPLPLVGILDHATFSNVQEQHKHLYQDCLGPWCEQLQEEVELQLLPEFPSPQRVYVEFNIADKLKGSFEEQASSLSTLVGRPVMTANEGRARLNLPQADGDADQLVTPLNVLVGGQASPRTPTETPKALTAPGAPAAVIYGERKAFDPTQPRLRQRHVEKWREVLAEGFERQRRVVLSRLGAKGRKASADELYPAARFSRELAGDLVALGTSTSTVWGKHTAEGLDGEFEPAKLQGWIREHSRRQAKGITDAIQAELEDALDEDDVAAAIGAVFDDTTGRRAALIAQSQVTAFANFGAHEGAVQSGAGEKTWLVTSQRPRPSHARMSGETVPLRDDFSIGGPWPGSPQLGPDENAGCTCSVAFG